MPRMNIKTPVRRVQAHVVRFEGRFVNGGWTVFDRHNFGHGLPVGTEKQMMQIVSDLNAGRLVWQA